MEAAVLLAKCGYSGKGCERDYDKAIPLFVDGMHRGCPLGADWLAEAYRVGKGVPKDVDKAKEIYSSCVEALEAMCASGCADAQYGLGFELLYGIFSAKNENKAYYWLEKAMKSGNVGAGVLVAEILINGWGQEKDEQAGIAILEGYANTTNNNAHFELGKIYYFGRLKEQNYKKALYHFKKAAERGHAYSQVYVGNIYYYGKGVSIDYVEARKWYELAENQGNNGAALSLGYIYFYGKGIAKDKQKAFKYFKESADKGNASAQYMLHYFYLQDEQFKNYELGRKYLEKSAEQGDVRAQKLLAKCYIGSFDFVEDDVKFAFWMRKAAEQNDAEAQRILGEAYIELENEKALPKSYPDAIEWLEKACINGDVEAAVLLAEVYSTVDGYKDTQKFSYYTDHAEQLMIEKEEKYGYFLGEEHEFLADLLYKYSDDKVLRQKSFDHYCRAFLAGRQSALYDLGRMYFVNGYTNDFFKLSPDELLQIIVEAEKDSKSSSLAYLLGFVYFNGYKVRSNKAAAENWYLKAVEKGSLSAACKLGYYYVDERQMYDKGFSILEKASADGSVEATRLLGLCYKKGIGVKKNRSKAKALLKEAAEKGDEDAVAELKKFIF